MASLKEIFVPKTKREWFKFAWDIFLVCFFVFMIYFSVSAFKEGFTLGQNSVDCIHKLYNFTNLSSSGTAIP